nr:PREDICTED: scavenger receptor cysteine-rich type 1 protein M130-like [Latimeria chalumnae]|eukprot:XP_014343911.1 PREDICTED: scavenger receptor cysteine-rich type 1 protein M130-like [Latimeria chalumnae]
MGHCSDPLLPRFVVLGSGENEELDSRHKESRLTGQQSQCAGRLELKYGDTWGTVCDTNFDVNDAAVICRDVGCGPLKRIEPEAHSKEVPKIWDKEIQCKGNESQLFYCPPALSGKDCKTNRIVSVACSVKKGSFSSLRLVNGSDGCSGRVELRRGDTWEAVCDSHWDLEEANVVCSHLDCGYAKDTLSASYFGNGSGPLWPSEFECKGTEPYLWNCTVSSERQRHCDYKTTAGVVCSADNWHVRLADGESRCDGRVEVYYNRTWGSVEDEEWGLQDAQVICRQLGCGEAIEAYNSTNYGQGKGPVWLRDVHCIGNESHLRHCDVSQLNLSLNASGGVGVLCSEHIHLRVVSAGSQCAGRVEAYYMGSWGTVCDDSWDLAEAAVVCKQLDCGPAVEATVSAHHGQGAGPVWLDDLQCRGNESLLWDCASGGWGQHDCRHKEDAGVICAEFKQLRLVSEEYECAGRLEAFYNGTWGSVCSNNMLRPTVAVVCRQLDCGDTGKTASSGQFGKGPGPKWLDNVKCHGNELFLWQCPSLPWGQNKCVDGEEAGIICSEQRRKRTLKREGPCPEDGSDTQCSEKDHVRLAGGESRCSGRVEVWFNASWGTVCDDSWDIRDAHVVCKQLNCGAAASALSEAHFGKGTGSIWLDEVNCRGTELSLLDCRTGWDKPDCDHKEDAGVICADALLTTMSTLQANRRTGNVPDCPYGL